MEGIDRESRPAGRDLSVLAFGDNADEIELAALDEARSFFGGDVQLKVIPDYRAHRIAAGGSAELQANGKAYHATVLVRTIEPRSEAS